jgi:hypothetical protein
MNGELLGLPDGYRLVRIGRPDVGESYLDGSHVVRYCAVNCMTQGWAIVEKIEPPKPKTRSVVLNRYLVWDDGTPAHGRVVECEESYVTACWHNFTLLGHSETIEVEVQV